MEYILDNGRKYNLSYQQLKEEHYRFCQMSDYEFMQNLPAAAHLACFICYLKEEPSYTCLCDIGIIHQLIHLIHIPESIKEELPEIREMFKNVLLLA